VDVTNVRVLSVSMDDTVVMGMNTDVLSLFIVVVDSVDGVSELLNGNLLVVSAVVDFEYEMVSTVDTFAVALVPVSNEEVKYEGDVVDNERY
jgi:hypothetical protein